MNNAKLWLVVPPKVGLPLFLSGVAISSFAVHVGIVANTSWIEDYHQGLPLGTGDRVAAAAVLDQQQPARTAPVRYAPELQEGAQDVLVILPDGTKAWAVLQMPEVVAAAGSPPRQAVD